MAATFPMIIAFAFMAAMLLIGTWLRANVPVFRAALIPASLIGGVVGFILISAGLSLGFEAGTFAPFTFHFFTLSFMSLVLTGSSAAAEKSSPIHRGGMWLTLIWTMSLGIQALIGFAVIAGYNGISGSSVSGFLGAISTYGYTMGPGQALTFGGIWEKSFHISDAATVGLIYASFGFIAAFCVGVPVARWAIKNGYNRNATAKIDDEFLRGYYDRETRVSAGTQVTHSANVDTLAFHVAILGVAYIITNGWLVFMQSVIGDARPLGVAVGVIFSHNLFFFWGLVICVLIRLLMERLRIGHFIDNDTQKRITGSAVDFMVVGTIMSIQFSVLLEFLVPVLLVTAAVTLVTALLCFGLGRKLADLGIERAVTIFGCCTGSTGTGLLLLRILDPDFSTTVSKELAFFNIAILFTCFHIILVMSPILPSYGMTTIWLVFGLTFVIAWAAIYAMGFLRGGSGFARSET